MSRRSSQRSTPRSNRRLTPEERLARNIAQENRPASKGTSRRRSGHAKPLSKAASEPVTVERTPSRIGLWFLRASSPIRQSLTGEWLGGPEVIRHLPFIGFIVVLLLTYTYLEYQYEYDERAIKEGRQELRNLRNHEQSLRGKFESQLQRSRLDEDMAEVGLSAPKAPPTALPTPTGTP